MGQEIRKDIIFLLNLEPLLRTVEKMNGLSSAVVILFVILASLAGGLVFLVMGNLLGWGHNFIATLSDGVEVELSLSQR